VVYNQWRVSEQALIVFNFELIILNFEFPVRVASRREGVDLVQLGCTGLQALCDRRKLFRGIGQPMRFVRKTYE
jgi:hypothetical protein